MIGAGYFIQYAPCQPTESDITMGDRLKVLMTQQEIANAIGCAQNFISYIFRGDRTPSAKMAEKLEAATQVCREAWLWPDRHRNPYMPFRSGSDCGNCKHKIMRMKNIISIILREVAKLNTKEQIIFTAHKVPLIISGKPTAEVYVIYREIFPDKIVMLSTTKRINPVPKTFYKSKDLWMYEILSNQGVYGVRQHMAKYPEFKEYINNVLKPMSAVMVGSGRHLVYTQMNRTYHTLWDNEIKRIMLEYIIALDEIWHQKFYA